MKRILVVYHTQSGNTERLAKALKEGASSVNGIRVFCKMASKATLKDLLTCDGYAFGTPDYFNYMAGALKDFFDRTCYPSEGKITSRPYVAFVSHGGGGEAINSLERMAKRFKLGKIASPLLVEGRPTNRDLELARELGIKLAHFVKGEDRHGRG